MQQRLPLLRLALGLALLLPSCLGGGGTVTGAGSGKALLYLENAEWGRLVDVIDSSGALVAQDEMIRESLQSDGVDYLLQLNSITGRETMTILHLGGSAAFNSALASAKSSLGSLQAKAFTEAPPFSKVARNGAIRLTFSEVLNPATVDRQTIQVLVAGANQNFQSLEVRYVVREVIGTDGKPKGVVILDPTISKLESENLEIPANGIGLPSSVDQISANIKVRIPTKVNPFINQTMVLTNKSGSRSIGVKTNTNNTVLEPVEYASGDPVAVRAFRSGNDADVFNGFMTDNARPSLISAQDVTLATVQNVSTLVRRLTYSMDAVRCRGLAPKLGDIFEVGSGILQTAVIVDASDPNALIVDATLLDGELGTTPNQQGTLTTRYGAADYSLQLCYVSFSPEPTTLPGIGVDPFATLTVRFSEPVDAGTVRSLDSMVLSSVDLTPTGAEDPTRAWNFDGLGEAVTAYIDRQLGFQNIATVSGSNGSGRIRFGPVQVSGDAQSYTLAPLNGLTDSHGEGGSTFYNLSLRDGPDGILDLAGNPMDFDSFIAGNTFQTEQITLAGTVPTDRYFALRCNSGDEDDDQGSEYAGQYGPFQGDGQMRPRAVSHFSRAVDPTNAWIGQRLRFANGLMTPLTPSGAVLMQAWPYHVMGFGLGSVNEYNLDVEGLSWSPYDGVVFDDIFARYSIALAHSNRLPDDIIDGGSGYPKWPNSGLRRLSTDPYDLNIFAFNYAPDPKDELIVFDTSYQISGINKYLNAGSNFMMPWPNFATTYTYRDTTFPKPDGVTLEGGNKVAGSSFGAPPEVLGQPLIYQYGKIPSIALPLLLRYRCYPRGQEFGFNGFQVQIMVGSSSVPAFRIFSSGGRDGQNVWHLVRPDLPTEGTNPTGGYNTTTGAVTQNHGPEVYWGMADFVTRISRVHTHWFGLGGSLASMSPLTVEPSPSGQLAGTQVIIELRGADTISTGVCDDPLTRMSDFDAYGDYVGSCSSVSGITAWSPSVAGLISGGKDYFQVRITFVSNISQDLDPVLDALGFAWNVQ